MSSGEDDSPASEDDVEIVEERENSDGENANNREQPPNAGEESAEPNQGAEAGEGEPQDSTKKEPKVKRVRNPQPKLNVERLKGPRGLLALGSMFKEVRFKGRHHEEEDLSRLMKTYEHWCHRMFPKFSFDDCIERIERLGNKKPMQTYLKRIRLDMVSEDPPPEQELQLVEENDDDDEPYSSNINVEKRSSNDQIFDNLMGNVQPVQSEATLTDEQLERIRINRERAQRLQRQRLLLQKKKPEAINRESNEWILSEKANEDESMSVDLSQTFESRVANENVELMPVTSQRSDTQKFDVLMSESCEPQPCCSRSLVSQKLWEEPMSVDISQEINSRELDGNGNSDSDCTQESQISQTDVNSHRLSAEMRQSASFVASSEETSVRELSDSKQVKQVHKDKNGKKDTVPVNASSEKTCISELRNGDKPNHGYMKQKRKSKTDEADASENLPASNGGAAEPESPNDSSEETCSKEFSEGNKLSSECISITQKGKNSDEVLASIEMMSVDILNDEICNRELSDKDKLDREQNYEDLDSTNDASRESHDQLDLRSDHTEQTQKSDGEKPSLFNEGMVEPMSVDAASQETYIGELNDRDEHIEGSEEGKSSNKYPESAETMSVDPSSEETYLRELGDNVK